MNTTKPRIISPLGAALAMAALAATGCWEGADTAPIRVPPPPKVDTTGALTSLVAILNPVVNAGHTKSVPFASNLEREGIPVDASPGSAGTTHAGLVELSTGVGAVGLHIGNGFLGHSVIVAGDAYDAVIGYNGTSASYYQNGYVRYPIGKASGAVTFGPTDALADLEAALAQPNALVVLRGGTYAGDLTIDGAGAMLIGEVSSEEAVVIDGSVTVNGAMARLRAITITGDLVAKGSDFGMTLSTARGATSITGNAPQLVRNVLCHVLQVETSEATLLDNAGLAPVEAPLEACQ